jgi:predicted O-methyltransferase YrrM
MIKRIGINAGTVPCYPAASPGHSRPSMTYIENIASWLKGEVAEPARVDANLLNQALRVLAIWRSRLMVDAFVKRHGARILQGPFAGMEYLQRAAEGALLPRLLGTYESELHPALLAFMARGVDCVIDVGCAEGYYAVGLARMAPEIMVYAHDTNPRAQGDCRELAAMNGVEDRVMVGGLFAPTDFEAFADQRCLVICDIEGAEDDLLRPDLAPALAGMALIVETHDLYRPGVLARITERFEATHHIQRLDLGHKTLPLPDWIRTLNHIDQLIAVWEWRSGPTPWLVMTPKV